MNHQKLILFFAFFISIAIYNPIQGQCPTIEAVMINGCSIPDEPDGEFMIVNTGGGFNVDDFGVEVPSNTTGVNDNMGTAGGCPFMTPPLNASLAGCPNVIEVGPGDFIPANSIVVIMTSSGGTAAEYDWTPLCGGGETVYLLQNSCDRTAGAFKDYEAGVGDRTINISTPACPTNEAIYFPEDLASGCSGNCGNGDYILPCVPSPTCPDGVQYGQNATDPCTVPPVTVPCTANTFDPVADVTECDSYTLPVITGSNLTGNEAYYTASGGGGTQYSAGATISSSTTLFLYDTTLSCTDEISFSITINTTPTPNTPTSEIDICFTIIPPALISENISDVENEITGGNGSLNVNWYLDMAGTNSIDLSDAGDIISLPNPATIYATVDDGTCESTTVPVTANLISPPDATPVTTTECDEGGGFATYDLTALENNIDGNGNTVTFYTDMAATNPISNPTNYNTQATTVYAVVSTGQGCDSEPVAVTLNVSPPLTADISVNPSSGCGSTDVTVTFIISGPDTYDVTIQISDASTGATTVTNNVGNNDTYTTTITETTEFVIVSAAFPTGGCPFTFPTSPEEVVIDDGPQIDFIDDVSVCGSYTLPAIPYISGATGNGAYYTGPNGTGTQYSAGEVINSTTQLYAFDGTPPDCFDEEPFLVTITQAPDLQLTGAAEICDGESLDLSTIVFDAQSTGAAITFHSDTPPGAGNQLPSTVVTPSNDSTFYAFAEISPGCDSELAILVTVLPLPQDGLAIISTGACDEGGGVATFDLTTFNDIINVGTGLPVQWSELTDPLTPINSPEAFVTGSTSVLGQSFNGTCYSEGDTVHLNVFPLPMTNPAGPLETCDNGTGQGTYNLTTLDNTINGGSGETVTWYLDEDATNQIGNPSNFTSLPTIVYAVINDGLCTSLPEPVDLNLLPVPEAFDYSLEDCGTPNAFFDLTSFEVTNAVSGGSGATLNWFSDPGGIAPLADPSNIITTITTVVYVNAELNGCVSPIAEVTLNVIQAPSATAAGLSDCDNGSGLATFDLTSLNNIVNNGTGFIVNYYTDNGATDLINVPNVFVSGGTTIFAQVVDGTCPSEVVPITLTLLPGPDAIDQTLSSCDAGNELGIFDLTSINFDVSQGSGNVSWFTSLNPDVPVPDDQAYVSGNGQVFAVVDNGTCSSEATITLEVTPGLDISLTETTPVSCFGSSDASIEVTVNNGTPTFTFDWNTDILDGIEDPTNVGAGTYEVTVTDADNCSGSGSITLMEPEELTLNCSENTPVSMINGNDGVGSVIISGGTAPFTIDYSGPVSGTQMANASGEALINNLEAGMYSITVTDDLNCTTTCTFTINEPGCNITLETMVIDPLCAGDTTGIINLTINGGMSPFDINWSVDSLYGLEDLVDLLAGDYHVIVTDGNGCTATTTVTVTDPEQLMLSCSENSPVSTQGGSDGIATIEFSGGTAPYDIEWNGPDTGNQTAPSAGMIDISGLPAGDYSLILTDINDCTTECSFTINEPGCNMTLETMVINPLCVGDTTGIIDLTINGGMSPFDIDWSVDSLDGLEDLVELLAGNYHVTVTDGNGCTAMTSAIVTDPASLIFSCSQYSPVSTPGGSDGIATVEFSGGTAPYTIDWNGPVSGSQNEAIPGMIDINGLPAGNYIVVLTDANGCTSDCQFTINDAGCMMTISITGFDESCQGVADGRIEVIVFNGTPDFTIDWDDDSLDGILEPMGISPGDYAVTVTDGAGCTATASITIGTTFASPTVNLNTAESICEGECIDLDFTMTGQPPFTVNYNFIDENSTINISFTSIIADTLIQICPGDINYTGDLITIKNIEITDANCNTQTTIIDSIHINTPTTSTVDDILCRGDSVVVNGTVYDNNLPNGMETLTGSNGCDSVVTINLTFLENPVFDLEVELCEGEEFIFNGTTYDANLTSGTELLIDAAANGCDSIVIVNLTFLETPEFDLDVELCEGEIFIFNGTTYDANLTSGTEILIDAAANGCDSIVNVNLTILENPEFDLEVELCEGENFIFNGTTYDANLTSGTEILPDAATNGCDSIVNVNLTFLENPEFDLDVELCEGENFIFNGTTYDANLPSGTEILLDAAANGCDSIVNVNLIFLENPEFDLDVELCEGENFIFNGTTYDANLTFGTEILPNAAANGCDSIVHVNLIFLENPEFDFNPELCEGESIIVNGTTYDENMTSGTEILVDAAANGCDSIVNVNLTFLETPEFDLNAELCEGEAIIVNGTTYDVNMPTGTEVLADAASNGCDSIVHVSLTFLQTPEFDLIETLCAGESITVNGNIYDASTPEGTEILEGAASNGCDSIVNVSLSFYSMLNASISGDTDICSGESTFITFNFNASETFSVQYSGENGELIMLNDIANGYSLEVSPSTTTTYGIEFIVVSGTNCPVNIENAATVNVSELTAQVAIDQEILCGNSADGALTANAGSGIPPYFYSWSNGGNSNSINNLSSGTYTVQVLDAAGCLVEASTTLQAPEALEALLVPEAPNCFDQQNGHLTIQNISGGSGNFEYSLDGEFFQPVTDLPFELSGLVPGDYSISIQDANDCLVEDQITIPEAEILTIDLGPDVFIDLGGSANLIGIPNFSVDSLIWFPLDSLSSTEDLSTLANPTSSTTYTILAFDEDGCPATDEVLVIVNRDVPVFIPTAFSPNGDGINDRFTVFGGQGVAMVNVLKIFDRWGNAVYEGGPFPPNDPNFGWNGKNQGQPMNPAVFVFYTEVIYLDGRKEVIKGDVMLVR